MLFKIKAKFLLCVTFILYITSVSGAGKLLGPKVFIVTPAPKPQQVNEGRSAPFYYRNWIRRIDSPQNITTTTTTTTPKSDTHDLIFAEFGDKEKSIRHLLEKESIRTTSTTIKPYLMEEDLSLRQNNNNKPGLEYEKPSKQDNENDMTDYFSMYNNLYNSVPSPVYLPMTTTTTSTTTTPIPNMDVKNIWHIIDEQKNTEYSSGQWEEHDLTNERNKVLDNDKGKEEREFLNENSALPGLNGDIHNKSENESRAIRTENNFQFPYVNLKTYQMEKPSHKKETNLYTNLDNFQNINYPIRGEAQDFVPNDTPIERYNAAQAYLPTKLKNKSKQSSPMPVKTVASLVPPPPPPSPPSKPSDDYFPPPSSYESFPPYPPSRPISYAPPPPSMESPVPAKPAPDYQSPILDNDSPLSNEDDSDTPSYQYQPPASQFLPTSPPATMNKPFSGYSYEKPPTVYDIPPMKTKPKYKKPAAMPPKDYNPPPTFDTYESDDHPSFDQPPTADDSPPLDTEPKYKKPVAMMPPEDHGPPSYGPYGGHGHHSLPDTGDYPELIYDKPHGDNADDSKDGQQGMDDNDMGMVPPPPPASKPDMDSSMDHGFPSDFPGGYKYHHDFDDFYHDHHHHHHHTTTTTTTTTTETPRVNRYSYYYLGKKLYYIPLYFSVYFIVYVGALVIKAVLRHKIVYPNSFRPNEGSSSFFSKRSVDNVDSWDFSGEKLHEVTRFVTNALAVAAEKYMNKET